MKLSTSLNRMVWFTSDLHLGHNKEFIWRDRGFNSSNDHIFGVIDSINLNVEDDDILFILGDFCLNSSLEEFETYIDSIFCKNIYLMFGNHPNPHYKNIYKKLVKDFLGDKYFDGCNVFPIKYKNIEYICPYTEISVDSVYIILCHYPILSWNYMMHGSWMLHGHEHSSILNHTSKGTNGKILDVSWDEFKRPLSYIELLEIMKNKKVSSTGHH
jgi:calcineurin-like phosphoesterase family protein